MSLKTAGSKMNLPIRLAGPLLAAAMGGLLLLALGRELAVWVLLAWLLGSGLSILGALRGRLPWFGGRQRFFLALAGVIAAVIGEGWGNWLPMFTQMVVWLLAVKALELRGQRDFYQMAALTLLGLGIAAWLRVDLIFAFLLLFTLYFALLGLMWQPLADVNQGLSGNLFQWREFARIAGFTLGFVFLLLPLAALFFLILPRTPTPLWAWAPPAQHARSGFSPELAPDSISQLASDSAIAFRAQITPPPGAAPSLYWIGAVLWRDDGRHWLPDPPKMAHGLAPDPATLGATAAFRQEIVLSPGNGDYLFALPVPRRVELGQPWHQEADGVLRLDHAPDLPLRYTVWSAPAPPQPLSAAERAAALQVPANTDPAIRALARSFAAGGSDNAAVVQRIMAWFHGPDFRYSLQSPSGYPDGQSMGDFLLRTHTGFCEFYAGGLALLLRLDGIPARVVTGYHGGEYNPVGHYWIIRQSMAHAWVQAWFPGRGWVGLDATPATASAGPARAGGGTARDVVPAGQQWWDWLQWQWINMVIDLTPAKQRAVWQQAGAQLASLARWHAPSLHAWKEQWKGWPSTLSFRSALPGMTALILVFLGIVRHYRRRHPAYWRRRAQRHLRHLGLGNVQPGAEPAFWSTLALPADTLEKLREFYREQRYGPAPTARRDHQLALTVRASQRQLRHPLT